VEPATGPQRAATGPQRAARGFPPREIPAYPLEAPGPAPWRAPVERAPLDRGPVPLDRGPAPVDRGPVPVGRMAAPVDRAPVPVDRAPVPADWVPVERGTVPGPVRRPRRRRRLVLALAAVVILGAAGAGAYKVFLDKGNSGTGAANPGLKLTTSEAPSNDPLYSAKLGKWQHIDTRKLDPQPLTIAQLYLPAFTYPSVGGIQFLRASADLTKTCGLAVFGEDLQAALQSGGCDQLARASYVSGDSTMMGTIGVANLSSTYWAEQAAKTTGSQELIAPLTASKGPTRDFLKSGTGLVSAEVKGHYLILLYVEFADLKAPASAAQKQQLQTFANDMFEGSANISLSQRLLGQAP